MRSKLDYVQPKKLNPADELRAMLDSLADRLPRVKSMTSAEAFALLKDLDTAHELFFQLEAGGLDLLPEQGRFDAIQVNLERNSRKLLQALGGETALTKHRPTPSPDRREQWWWYANEVVATWKKRLYKRLAITAVIIMAVIGVVVIAFNTVLAPSPEAVARVEAETDAFNAISAGNYADALVALERGLAVVPNDSNLLVIKGVTHEFLGDEVKAAEIFEQAQAQLDNPAVFYLGRGQIYLRTNQNEKAEADARAALVLDDNVSTAWLLLGQSLEAQGKKLEAVSAYQKAGDIALENGDNEVVVLARLALSRVAGFGP